MCGRGRREDPCAHRCDVHLPNTYLTSSCTCDNACWHSQPILSALLSCFHLKQKQGWSVYSRLYLLTVYNVCIEAGSIVYIHIPLSLVATFKGPLEKQAAFMSEVSKHADAAVILTNQIATFEQDDSQWIANAETLLKLTGDIAVGIYETPVPRCRWGAG